MFIYITVNYLTIVVAFQLTVILHKHDSFYCVRIIYYVCNGLKEEALNPGKIVTKLMFDH